MKFNEKLALWLMFIILFSGMFINIAIQEKEQKYLNDFINMNYQQMDEIDFNMERMQSSIEKLVPVAENITLYNLGTFRITYYCNDCDECGTDGITSDGSKLDNTYNSVAVDKSIIPEGSRLLINGTEYIANDVGGEINGKDIDIVVYDTPHEIVHDMGVDHYEVYIIIPEK